MPYADKDKRVAYQTQWWQEHKTEQNTRRRIAYQENREVRLEQHRLYRENVHMPRKYNITPEQKKAMWEQQGQACALCLRPIKLKGSGTHIDHDHKTGRVRGLLCKNCNTALGLFEDNADTLRRAAAYVEVDRGRNDSENAA